MVKISYTLRNGSLGHGFGLSAENMRKLKEGRPIFVELSEIGGSGTILIFYGETEEEMQEMLTEFIGPDTLTHFEKGMVN